MSLAYASIFLDVATTTTSTTTATTTATADITTITTTTAAAAAISIAGRMMTNVLRPHVIHQLSLFTFMSLSLILFMPMRLT